MSRCEQLDAEKSYWGFLQGQDAWLYLSLRSSPNKRTGGRPRKHRTVAEVNALHAARQRRYRQRLEVTQNSIAA